MFEDYRYYSIVWYSFTLSHFRHGFLFWTTGQTIIEILLAVAEFAPSISLRFRMCAEFLNGGGVLSFCIIFKSVYLY